MSELTASNYKMLDYGINVQDRIIYIFSDIDENTMTRVWMGLQAILWDNKTKPITLHLSTNGGEVEAGLAIYDMLKGCGCKVHVHVQGFAHSMGIIILQAGSTRSMSPNAAIMAHWGRQGAEDTNPENYKRKLKFQSDLDDKCDNILLAAMQRVKPKTTLKKIKDLTRLDWYMHPKEALENGFVDEIRG
jgi:ATP-dependent Clp protease protease subunit